MTADEPPPGGRPECPLRAPEELRAPLEAATALLRGADAPSPGSELGPPSPSALASAMRDLRPDLPPRRALARALRLLGNAGTCVGAAAARQVLAPDAGRGPGAVLAGPLQLCRLTCAAGTLLPGTRLGAAEQLTLILELERTVEHPAAPADGSVEMGGAGCSFSAGFVAGWCSAALGCDVACAEITCRARGQQRCRFVAAPRALLADRVAAHVEADPSPLGGAADPEIPASLAALTAPDEASPREDGSLPHTLMLNRVLREEIAEHSRRRGEHQRAEQRCRELFDHIHDAVIVHELTAEGHAARIIEANATACQLAGYDRAELLRLTPLHLLVPRGEQDLASCLERAAAGEQDRFEAALVSRARRRIPVAVQAQPLELDGRRVMLATIHDHTERVRAEVERARLQEQLHQAQKMEAVSQLSGGLAHDFNNMLTAIMSDCELLRAEIDSADRRREPVEEIMRAASRAAAMTKRLLTISRQELLRPEPLRLDQAVRRMELLIRRTLPDEIELQLRLDADTGRVLADPAKLEQIVLTLVSNARDAMDRGGVLVLETRSVDLDDAYARSHVSVKPGRYALLAVSDSGRGMDRATCARIFDPFFTTKDPARGSGLGLTIAYGIVKQGGGNIWAHSEPDQGTTIKVYLPRLSLPDMTAETAPVADRPGAETILLVEDEELTRGVASRVLRREGYVVLEARNGVEALHIFEGHRGPIHLLVTDLMVPRMNGRELAERLTRGNPELKVLFMSGYTNDLLVQQSLLERGVVFLEKPFTPTLLRAKVSEVLRGVSP